MTTRESDENPFLQGNFAPWRVEGDAPDLEVIGELPRELNGTFYRNGPNPAFEPPGRYHWFDGDGMIHAIRLEDGRASLPQPLGAEPRARGGARGGPALYPGLLDMQPSEAPSFKNTANTNIVWHARQAARADGGGAADAAAARHARHHRRVRLRRPSRRRR